MIENKQQTAVEYLIHHIRQDVFVHSKSTKEWNQVFQQAKEMEKQQIINSFWNGDNTDCTSEQNVKEFAEQYYQQTYGKNHIGDVNKMVGGEQ
jgi:hypothetical protein